MRVLAVSNFYPPHYIGGYELGCKDVIDALRDRGHDVSVLTSLHGVAGPETAAGVYRRLHPGGLSTLPKGSLLQAMAVEFRDHAILTGLVSEQKPQLISVWNLGGLADNLLVTIQRLKIPVVCHISDDWLVNKLGRNLWRRRSVRRTSRVAKVVLRLVLDLLFPHSVLPDPGGFKPRHCYFTSTALRELYVHCGFPLADARVIHWGIPLEKFVPRRKKALGNETKLLLVGQLEKHKGAHTVLEALGKLVNSKGVRGARLAIVGAGRDPEYDKRLADMVIDANLQGHVEFLGKLPRETMPKIYNEHDILIFPSIWEEPFSLTLLEAMACGMAVVGTTTGGSKEVLIDGWNSLTFRAEDADQLAMQVERLIANDELRQQLSQNALKTVQSRFDVYRMVDQIEDLFKEAMSENMRQVAL